MSTKARKARKRSGLKHMPTPKPKPAPRGPSLGLMGFPEWQARLLASRH